MESATVIVSPEALAEADKLPRVIHGRVVRIVERLAAWPNVSGAKPLRHGLAGRYRIRTGDYRVQFRVEGRTVIVEKIGHRDGFYEE
jgi:mRNA interferase RelE/StbE